MVPMSRSDDLLEQGVVRFLPGAAYQSAAGGYARITHALNLQRFPREHPAALERYVLTPERPPRARAAGSGPAAGSVAVGGATRTRVVLMDIESLGFIGSPLFLIGGLYVTAAAGPTDAAPTDAAPTHAAPTHAAHAELVQYFARDYSEERAILEAFAVDAAEADLWISYNGASFDLPFLELRAVQHRLAAYRPPRHLDLLPVARRLWAARLPNCKLKTVEHHICERPRGADIEGARIPPAYHAFVRSGEPFEMLEVLRHNVHDLTSLLELYRRARRALAAAGGEDH